MAYDAHKGDIPAKKMSSRQVVIGRMCTVSVPPACVLCRSSLPRSLLCISWYCACMYACVFVYMCTYVRVCMSIHSTVCDVSKHESRVCIYSNVCTHSRSNTYSRCAHSQKKHSHSLVHSLNQAYKVFAETIFS